MPQEPASLQHAEPPHVGGDLEDVAVRVVRLEQLGSALPTPAPPNELPPPRPVTPRAPAISTPAVAPPATSVSTNARATPAAAPPARGPDQGTPPPRALDSATARQRPPNPATPDTPQPTVARPAPRAPPAAPHAEQLATRARRRLFSWNRVGFVALVVVLYLGWRLPTERYITPTRGMGYALGIIGGSLMLLLLVYSARKHFRWLRFLGPTPAWFRFHMVLGIAGPLCILFHANFRTGAANSNVALFCMLTVAGSGFIGRYLYAHIHYGLYGRKLELGDLQASATGLRALSGSVSFLPDLVTRLEAAEQRLLRCGPRMSLLAFLRPVAISCSAIKARWQLHRYVRRGLRDSARTSAVVAAESTRLRRTARAYIDRRLTATQRVAQFQGYERLFSLWHALHIPLIFMLIIAAVVHVIAVNVY